MASAKDMALRNVFIQEKVLSNISKNILLFHENDKEVLGTIRVSSKILESFGLKENRTYDIYIKLKNTLSDEDDICTRLVVATLIV